MSGHVFLNFYFPEELKETLDIYIEETFGPIVKILRSSDPLGLIRARLWGIRSANGQVVIVMDSHIEVQPNW